MFFVDGGEVVEEIPLCFFLGRGGTASLSSQGSSFVVVGLHHSAKRLDQPVRNEKMSEQKKNM